MDEHREEHFDTKIKKALEYGTNSSTDRKEEIWQAIKAQTIKSSKGVRRMNKKRKKSFATVFATGTVAAAILLSFFLGTEPGKAAVDKIKELFEPQKKIVQELEGNQENTLVELEQSKMGYILYVDKEYYDVIHKDGADRIVPKYQGEGLPDVFMEITQVEDKGVDAVADDIINNLKSKYPIVENRGQVSDPVKGTLIHAASGNEWDDIILKYYIIDNTKGGAFVIEQQYFLEAAEGHGARFYHILKEFQIVDID